MITDTIPLTARTDGASDYRAELHCYIPDLSPEIDLQRKRKAVIVCPGGAYVGTSDREAEAVALVFAAAGLAAFVLRYSCRPAVYPQALCELAEAIRLIRSQEREWGIDVNGVVPCGFSAGGHLCASIANRWNGPEVQRYLAGGPEAFRPDGVILGYPVIEWSDHTHTDTFRFLLGDGFSEERANAVSWERQVGPQTAKAFIWHTANDSTVPVNNSLHYAAALAAQQIPFELHIYPDGVHGLSLANDVISNGDPNILRPDCARWIEEAIRWVKEQV